MTIAIASPGRGRFDFLCGLGDCGLLRRQFLLAQQPAERCDFDRLRAELDVRQSEAAADDPAVPEHALHFVRMRRGADVEILGPSPEQQIANAAADEIRDVVELTEARQHFQRVGIDQRA